MPKCLAVLSLIIAPVFGATVQIIATVPRAVDTVTPESEFRFKVELRPPDANVRVFWIRGNVEDVKSDIASNDRGNWHSMNNVGDGEYLGTDHSFAGYDAGVYNFTFFVIANDTLVANRTVRVRVSKPK